MNERGILNIEVTDDAGHPMPCRLHIKQADDSCWVPADVGHPDWSAPIDLLHFA